MTLDPRLPYPTARSYVLKLHREAVSENAELIGRLENMASGRHFDFSSGTQLIACLIDDLKSFAPDPTEADALRPSGQYTKK